MPTRQGWTVVIGAIAALIVGRVFGIIELFVIGSGLAIAVLFAVVIVRVVTPRLVVSRWAHPSMLAVGDTGRVDLAVQNSSRWRSPRVTLIEPVGRSNSAHMAVGSLRPGAEVTAGYRVPALRRGVIELGPTIIERYDVLGLASNDRLGSGVTELAVTPHTVPLTMPSLGAGMLGRHLQAISQRIGPGEFHSLRDYNIGDELRSIHWRASARSDGLKVRQHESQGVRRCIVILDRAQAAFPGLLLDADPDAFERAVTAAASLVIAADRSGLTTRFVTGGGIDLRGPDVATHTLELLAAIDVGPAIAEPERDPGEGLGLVLVVTSSPDSAAWRLTDRANDPTLTRVGVFTHSMRGAEAATRVRLAVDATSVDSLRENWDRLTGTAAQPAAAGGTGGVTA